MYLHLMPNALTFCVIQVKAVYIFTLFPITIGGLENRHLNVFGTIVRALHAALAS